jgi:mono/diheme cytochrome c family protein
MTGPFQSDTPREALSVTARLSLQMAAPALLALLLLSGCESEYAEDFRYPLRTDPLVDGQLVPADPALVHMDKPGEFLKPGFLSFSMVNVPEDEKRSKIFEPGRLDPDQRRQIETTLEEMFGTPRQPRVAGFEDEEEIQRVLKLDKETLAEGSSLYRIHCLHCHGVTGNGQGPTAPWVNPHPRDYRRGKFKFTSVDAAGPSSGGNERKARREDLLRTIREGVEGTSMPSFSLLHPHQLEALVSYVIHLSMRGQVEFWVMRDLLKGEGSASDLPIPDQIQEIMAGVVDWWKAAQDEENLIRPPADSVPPAKDLEASVKRGYRLFQKEGAGCMGCHEDYGRQGKLFYDEWGTIGQPADLTTGVYRGGRRPIDLYWRIHSGVNGSNMPASTGRKPQELWDLVHFVQALPYPAMREKYGLKID